MLCRPTLRQLTKYYFFIFILFTSLSAVYSQKGRIQWTPEETHWIKQHQVISFGYEPRWEPYEIYENDEYSGIVGEYVKILERETGIDFQPIKNLTWDKTLNGLRNGNIKMVPCCAITPQRKNFLNFSEIYLKDPIVIVTRSDAPYFSTLDDLRGQEIALSKNYYTIELVKERYNDIDINEKESIEACLTSVINKESVAFIGNLNVITYYMNHMGFSNLKIVGTTPFTSGDIAMAVTDEYKPLVPIINKVLKHVSSKEKHAIRREWIANSGNTSFFQSQYFYWTLFIIGGLILSFTVLYYWNNVLRKIVQRKKKTEQQLKESLIAIKKNNEEKKVLLQEIHHRVKNNLQVVSSMMRLQANIVKDPNASRMLNEAVERIKTIALVHDRIYKSTNIDSVKLQEYTETLYNDITSQFDGVKKPILELTGDNIDVQMDKIVPIALILNELITNSIKYAFDNQDNPKISVLIKLPESEKGLIINYSDNGCWKESENSDHFGTSLIEIFTEQLDGAYELNKSDDGTVYYFEFNTNLTDK
tara:strand:+ start:133764 stop:135362 length:1599 start_codon:yes stop_codon:yes gene_type:complete